MNSRLLIPDDDESGQGAQIYSGQRLRRNLGLMPYGSLIFAHYVQMNEGAGMMVMDITADATAATLLL